MTIESDFWDALNEEIQQIGKSSGEAQRIVEQIKPTIRRYIMLRLAWQEQKFILERKNGRNDGHQQSHTF